MQTSMTRHFWRKPKSQKHVTEINDLITNRKTNKRDEIYFTLPLVLFWISFSFSGFLRRRKIHQSSSFRAKPGKYNNKNKNWTKNHSPRAVLMTRHVTHISRVASLVTSLTGLQTRLRMSCVAWLIARKLGRYQLINGRGRRKIRSPHYPWLRRFVFCSRSNSRTEHLLQWFLRTIFITAVG